MAITIMSGALARWNQVSSYSILSFRVSTILENKVGTWKYYILVNNEKVLIASVDYKVVKNSKALSFVARKDYSDFCLGLATY